MTQQTCKHDKFMGGVCVKCDYVAFSNLPMTQQTLKELLEKIYHSVQLGPVAENNAYGIMHSTLCVDCIDDPISEDINDRRAYYIYQGKSLCITHLNKLKLKEEV